MEMVLPLALVVGVMWLMTNRTRKQQRAAADFRANLEVGQEVMTGSGLFGTIVDVDGDTITLESTPGSQTRWIRAAIAKVVPVEEVVEDDDTLVEDDGTTDLDDADRTAAHTVDDGDLTARADRFDVPDDLSTLDERRRDDPETR